MPTVPISDNTLGQMKADIADELARSDLATQTAAAIEVAIDFYRNERFDFNESRDLTFSTVAGQEFYTGTDLAAIPNIMAFDNLILYLGTIPWPLYRDTNNGIEVFNQNGLVRGQPTRYTMYNKQIRIGPVPDTVYSLRITGQISFASPADDAEAGNPWMVDAEKLIRCRAKYELLQNVIKDYDEAKIMWAQLQEAEDNLKGRTNRRLGRGMMQPVAF